MAPPQNDSRENMDLKMPANISYHEQQLDGSPKNDIAEGDDNMPLKDANCKHGGGKNEVQETIPGMKNVEANIETLPTELTLRIFRLLKKASAACLGLTCPRLYACLKYHYPEPICLSCHECCGLKCDRSIGSHSIMTPAPLCSGYPMWEHWNHKQDLGNQIKKWIGPQYTLVTLDVGLRERYSVFVHSNVSNCSTGTIGWDVPVGEHVSSLWTRYNDWAYAAFDNKVSIHDPGFRSRLPTPYNKGDSWTSEAMAAIKEDIVRFDNVEDWRNFWHSFEVVRENKDTFNLWLEEFSLEQMHDGIMLLGL